MKNKILDSSFSSVPSCLCEKKNNIGRLISFEGPEGGGKSTHIHLLAERLRTEKGLTILTTREPGGTPTGELIRGLLQHNAAGEPLCDRAEALLFCASRSQLCHDVLAPALSRGEWVLCDRFTDSTLAYQGYGRGFDLETLRRLNDFATGPAVTPSLTLLLDVPTELGMRRITARGGADGLKDRIECEDLDFHKRLRNGYLELARHEPTRIAVIDATQPVATVAAQIWNIVCERLLGQGGK